MSTRNAAETATDGFQAGLIVTRLEKKADRHIVTAEAGEGASLTLPLRRDVPLPKLGAVIYLRWDTA